MDTAFNQHSSHARRKNRSTTNLNHLSLAPLTSKLPINDDDELPDPSAAPLQHSTSYLQGKSAPTTPGLLTRSPARSNSRGRAAVTPGPARIPKSKSTTHIAAGHGRNGASGTLTPGARRRKEEALSARDRTDSDWLLRVGALISTETREYKGQSWLVSRASSTSLAGMPDPEEDAFEQELARERELASRHASRRGSLADDHLVSPATSRLGSRSHSRAGSRVHMLEPAGERRSLDGYFPAQVDGEEYVPGPDFVNLDEKLEAVEQDTSAEDEAHVRRLVKRGQAGVGTWFGNVLGWQLSAVEENEEESDGEDDEDYEAEDTADGQDELGDATQQRRAQLALRQFESSSISAEEDIPPPKASAEGWQDAAWLLSVASKVLL